MNNLLAETLLIGAVLIYFILSFIVTIKTYDDFDYVKWYKKIIIILLTFPQSVLLVAFCSIMLFEGFIDWLKK